MKALHKAADTQQGEPVAISATDVILAIGDRLQAIIAYCRAELQTAHGKERRRMLHILDIAEGRK